MDTPEDSSNLPCAPTRENLDKALAALPGDNTDAEIIVAALRAHFGELLTVEDEAKARELLKPADPAPTPKPPSAPKGKRTVRTQVKETTVLATTAEKVTTTAVQDTQVDELPASVTLAAPYAFYDDEGALRSWGQGRVVDDPAEIALLVERGAIFEA